MGDEAQVISFELTKPQLALLKKLDFPTSQDLLASAVATERGWFELTGTRLELESLVGWVAGEANHSRAGPKQDTLMEIADELEASLAGAAWR